MIYNISKITSEYIPWCGISTCRLCPYNPQKGLLVELVVALQLCADDLEGDVEICLLRWPSGARLASLADSDARWQLDGSGVVHWVYKDELITDGGAGESRGLLRTVMVEFWKFILQIDSRQPCVGLLLLNNHNSRHVSVSCGHTGHSIVTDIGSHIVACDI